MKMAALLLACLAKGVASSHLFPSGDVTIVSDVQWRHLDSFWKANASHVDLYNIVLEGRTLHLYLPDAEEIARVRALFSHFKDPNTLPTYSKATTDLENFELVIENEPLDPDTCDFKIDGSAFVDAPWYHNVYHVHAKNMIPMAAVLLTTPPLVPGAGACVRLPCTDQLGETLLLHHYPPRFNQRMITKVHHALFSDAMSLPEIFESEKRFCVRHLSWGPGTEMFAVNGHLPHYVKEARVAMTALRTFALDTFLPDAQHTSDKNGRGRGETLRALWISRQPKDNVGQVQTGRNRWIQNPEALKAAFEGFPNVEVVECCDWNRVTMADMMRKISSADIVYGLHGAGLANALYARKGVKLIEIVGNYGGQSNFYSRVAGARYGDWIRVNVPHSNFVYPELARDVAACATALWRATPSRPAQEWTRPPLECAHPDIEVVRTAVEIKHEDPQGEDLPLEIEFAPCDSSPRCVIQALGPGGPLRMMGFEVDGEGNPVMGPGGRMKRHPDGPFVHRGDDDPPPLRPRPHGDL